jgi:ferredoxin
MIRVTVNRDTCEGFATCIRNAPKVFDLGDDDRVLLRDELLPDSELARIRQAAYDCPTETISFTRESEGRR